MIFQDEGAAPAGDAPAEGGDESAAPAGDAPAEGGDESTV